MLTTFAVEEITVGSDEDGEPLVIGILSTDAVSAVMPKARRTSRQDLALSALDRTIRDSGQEPPAGADIPPWLKVASVEQWRNELFRCGVLDRDAKNPRSAFKKLKTACCRARGYRAR